MTASTPEEFRAQLLATGLLAVTEEDGIYALSETFDHLVLAFDALVDRHGTALGATRWRFPPIQSRKGFERTGFLTSFPHLAGSVHVFTDGDQEHAELLHRLDSGDDWSQQLSPARSVLCSACCQPLYPMVSGRLPVEGLLVDLSGWCFRHEPSRDPRRMQAFRQHEVVYFGNPEGSRRHLESSLAYASDLLSSLGLAVEDVVTNDPFFGRIGSILTESMLNAELKHELVAAVASEGASTALFSANEHRDHFSSAFGIQQSDGTLADTACAGFGLERVVLALLDCHGLDPARWPASVRQQLGI